jgi:hypothetical protein
MARLVRHVPDVAAIIAMVALGAWRPGDARPAGSSALLSKPTAEPGRLTCVYNRSETAGSLVRRYRFRRILKHAARRDSAAAGQG